MIEVTIDYQSKDDSYPRLLKSKTEPFIVILANKYILGGTIKGAVVNCDEYYENHIGYYSSTWDAKNFEDFNGTLTLKNK